jgi:predicted SnoaL-like aldol condensation-catalyzing enzyme
MSKENKAMVRRTMEALWNQGDLAVADERFASDYVGNAPDKIEGPEGVKQFVSAMRNAAPEIKIEDQIAEGDTMYPLSADKMLPVFEFNVYLT